MQANPAKAQRRFSQPFQHLSGYLKSGSSIGTRKVVYLNHVLRSTRNVRQRFDKKTGNKLDFFERIRTVPDDLESRTVRLVTVVRRGKVLLRFDSGGWLQLRFRALQRRVRSEV